MSYTSEDIKKASELFFYLLDKKIVPSSDVLANEYYNGSDYVKDYDEFLEEVNNVK